MRYGGNVSAVKGFPFFGGKNFGGNGKPKYGGNYSAVMRYGGTFSRQAVFIFWR